MAGDRPVSLEPRIDIDGLSSQQPGEQGGTAWGNVARHGLSRITRDDQHAWPLRELIKTYLEKGG